MGKKFEKKAVVIGATGNLGREICKELKKLNFDVDQTWTSKKDLMFYQKMHLKITKKNSYSNLCSWY